MECLTCTRRSTFSSSAVKGEKERIVPGDRYWMVGIVEILFCLKQETGFSAESEIGEKSKLDK